VAIQTPAGDPINPVTEVAMALDPRKRQKKLERKKAKQRTRKTAVARYGSSDIATRLERYAAAPILHCAATGVVWTEGIGNVLVSRELSNGNVAVAVFLVDMYCLGVKDAFYDIRPRHLYSELYRRIFGAYEQVELEPACARKLVEGAVAYAQDLGFLPHADYRVARLIFGDVDPAGCEQDFQYGREGKPFFIAGPSDDLPRCKWIVGQLSQRCGEGNFDYVVPLSESAMLGELPGLLPEHFEKADRPGG
jgi:hypothetical protein